MQETGTSNNEGGGKKGKPLKRQRGKVWEKRASGTFRKNLRDLERELGK